MAKLSKKEALEIKEGIWKIIRENEGISTEELFHKNFMIRLALRNIPANKLLNEILLEDKVFRVKIRTSPNYISMSFQRDYLFARKVDVEKSWK